MESSTGDLREVVEADTAAEATPEGTQPVEDARALAAPGGLMLDGEEARRGVDEMVHVDASQVVSAASDAPVTQATSDTAAALGAVAAVASAAASTAAAAASATNAKRPWSDEEDQLLLEAIMQHGALRWSLIAILVQHNRTGKQCRERWFNHLCPDVKKGEWTEEEDRLILEAVREMGTKWSQIAKCFPGRTENSIKNRFHSIKRKGERRAQSLRASKRKREDEEGGGDGEDE
jgi:hypothetical protein